MKTTFVVVFTFLLAVLIGCSPAVTVQQKPGADFSKYRTYAWAKTDVKSASSANPIYQSSLNDEVIQNAVNGELAKRGLRVVQGRARPDFYVSYHLYIEEAERTVANPPASGFAYPYAMTYRGALLPINYGYWYTSPYYNTGYRTETYQEGTMILDIADARSHNLVWRGSVADPVGNPANIGNEFARAAKDILEKFPTTAAK